LQIYFCPRCELGFEDCPNVTFIPYSIFIVGNSANVVQRKINETINKLTDWFERNRLIINKEKTIAISFHQSQKIQLRMPINKTE
jgi:hypothetical protein